jgi:hypothetical protein
MKRLIFYFSFLSYNSFAQIKPGLYKEVSDTVYIGKHWTISYSQLFINNDNTFSYNYRASSGCLLWYDINGKWFTRSGKVYLIDSALSQNVLSDTVALIRTTVFKIQKNKLKHFNSFFEGIEYSPLRNIEGNFIYKDD